MERIKIMEIIEIMETMNALQGVLSLINTMETLQARLMRSNGKTKQETKKAGKIPGPAYRLPSNQL